jgi:hypothetical protein
MVETVGFRQVMWFVMLESAKDRVLGVDTPGQQVPPRVQCGTACLPIGDVVRLARWCGERRRTRSDPQGARRARVKRKP